MQSQQTIIKTPVHVKVAYDGEFRRFLLSPITFENLQSTLKTLFSIESEISIKFQDDENDWVLMSTDQELVYATELSGSPLRLQVKPVSSQPPKAGAGPFAATERGRGRGCRGRGWGNGRGLKSPEERLRNKSSRFTERIAMLEAKLSSDKLTSERERVLRWKLAKLQEKLAAIKTSLEQFGDALQQPQAATVPTEVVSSTEDVLEAQEEKSSQCRGGRRGRGGRGGCRRAMMEDGSDQPVWKGCRRARIAPEIIANFRQCKANLRAARESGNAEEIQACREALKAARDAKIAAMDALDAQASVDEQKA
jgi:hypothetical protein